MPSIAMDGTPPRAHGTAVGLTCLHRRAHWQAGCLLCALACTPAPVLSGRQLYFSICPTLYTPVNKLTRLVARASSTSAPAWPKSDASTLAH